MPQKGLGGGRRDFLGTAVVPGRRDHRVSTDRGHPGGGVFAVPGGGSTASTISLSPPTHAACRSPSRNDVPCSGISHVARVTGVSGARRALGSALGSSAQLQRALAAGNLIAAEQAAFEIPIRPTGRGPGLVELHAEKGDRKFERAALKYLRRHMDEVGPVAQVATLPAERDLMIRGDWRLDASRLPGVYVPREQREHDAVVSLAVGLAMGAEDAFALKTSLLDRPDRSLVICCRLSEHPTEPKLAQTPGRCEA